MSLTKSIADLFLELPFADYLSVDEIRDILVTQLEVLPKLSGNDVQRACQSLSRSCLIVSRLHTKAKAKTRYYAAAVRHETCVLFPDRLADWHIPILDLSFFQKSEVQILVQNINEHLKSGEEFVAIPAEGATQPLIAEDSVTQPVRGCVVVDNKSTSGITKFCPGFVGPKINELFKQSLIDGPLRDFDMSKPFPISFGLPSCMSENKGIVNDLQFTLNDDLTWKLASKTCLGEYVSSSNRQVFCSSCQLTKLALHNLCRSRGAEVGTTNAYGDRMLKNKDRITDRSVLSLCHRPENVRLLLDDIRRHKDNQLERLRRQISINTQDILENAASDTVFLDSVDDVERGQKAFELLKPLIVQKYGETSEAVIIWEQMIKGMTISSDGKARYSEPALMYGIELAAQTKAEVYKKLSSLLNLPSRNHLKKLQRAIVYGKNGCYKHGFQSHSVLQFHQLAREKGLCSHGPISVCLAFDAMIMKKNIMLSSRNDDKGRFIGCILSNELPTLERHFDNYVQQVTRKARKDGCQVFDEAISDTFQHNKEHLICYVKSMTPGVDLSFIAGAWNLPAFRKIDLIQAVHELILGLFNNHFEVRVITCDNAQANEGFLKATSSLKASDLLPKSLLGEFGLDGNFRIGTRHPITDNPIMYISDPPHCIKCLAGAVRSRNLHYDQCPMTGKLLFDVWQAIELSHGELLTSLGMNRKYEYRDFIDTGGFSAMNVSSASRLFSNTTRKMIDEVVSHPQKYPLNGKLPIGLNRQLFFSKVAELVTMINDLFDLCNGKDGNNLFLRFRSKNGDCYMRKFLGTLRWFRRWELSVKLKPKKDEIIQEHFIATETYRSLKYVWYGFSCLIMYECVEHHREISPSKISQDICEHHFANVRRNCASHANPNEIECMSGVMKSCFFRMEKIQKSNCGVLPEEHQRTILPLITPVLRRNNNNKRTRSESLQRLRSQFGKKENDVQKYKD